MDSNNFNAVFEFTFFDSENVDLVFRCCIVIEFFIEFCCPRGSATIFINGIRIEMSRSSRGFKSDSSDGTGSNSNPFAFTRTGILSFNNVASHV